MGFGVWVWGMGPNPQSPIPNPPIPNPHLQFSSIILIKNINLNKIYILYKIFPLFSIYKIKYKKKPH
jgi:hypothetical protein